MKITGLIRSFGYTFMLMALLGASCGSKEIDETKAPVPKAGFSFSVDVANKLTINFTNESENAALYTWDFGDNTKISVDKNPVHTYTKAGTYSVTLIVKNGVGVTDTKKTDITVEANAPPSDNDTPIWVEEFEGSTLNTNIWTPIRGTEPYTYGSPYNPSSDDNGFDKSMVSVANGNLVIKWENTPVTIGGETYKYTAGTVHSGKGKYFGPGHYIEAKIKFTRTPGLWHAFWLLPLPVDDHWPPEIDIAELTTSDTPDDLYHPHFNYHWVENDAHEQMGWKWYGTSGVDYSNDWHTYGLLWKQGFLQAFIDGEAGPMYQAPNVSSEEMYIILSTGVKKNATPANGEMLVDYVKIWKR